MGPMGRPLDMGSISFHGGLESKVGEESYSHGCNCRMARTEHVEGLSCFEEGVAHCIVVSDSVLEAVSVSDSFDHGKGCELYLSEGTVSLATGDDGCVYKVAHRGECAVLVKFEDAHWKILDGIRCWHALTRRSILAS